jgi:hypothetical protein
MLNEQLLIALAVILGVTGLLGTAIFRLATIAKDNEDARQAYLNLMNPASIVSLLILLGVLFLLGMAILDLDKGRVLVGMGKTAFARGLITYLFAVVTIGTAVVLVLSALLGTDKAKFDSAKEVLALLLGVFGTIVGFYFASELAAAENTRQLTVSAVLSAQEAAPGSSLTVTASVIGGSAPFRYSMVIDADPPRDPGELVRPDGWIIRTVTLPAATSPGLHRIRITVQDAQSVTAFAEALVSVGAIAR